jgi:hypothetical protein
LSGNFSSSEGSKSLVLNMSGKILPIAKTTFNVL